MLKTIKEPTLIFTGFKRSWLPWVNARIERIEQRLQKEFPDAEIYTPEYKNAALIDFLQYSANTANVDKKPLVVIGHSHGVRNAVEFCESLGLYNVHKIDFFAAIEPVAYRENLVVPDYVKSVLQLFATKGKTPVQRIRSGFTIAVLNAGKIKTSVVKKIPMTNHINIMHDVQMYSYLKSRIKMMTSKITTFDTKKIPVGTFDNPVTSKKQKQSVDKARKTAIKNSKSAMKDLINNPVRESFIKQCRDSQMFRGNLSREQFIGLTELYDAMLKYNIINLHHKANILSQVFHETGRQMFPVKETVMPHHKTRNPSDEEVKRRLERAWGRGQLPWVKKRYWANGWFGRGMMQITHKRNYEKLGKALGIDLVSNPDKTLEPKTAAAIAVIGMRDGLFTGKKLANYAYPDALYAQPNKHPRRIVNGKDGTDAKIRINHMKFYNMLKKAQLASVEV